MRILILSCNTGEGHNSAAKAISEVLTARGIENEITDALSFWSPKISKFICNWHVRLYKRAPIIFRMGYRMAEDHDPEPEDTSMVYNLLSQGAKKLYEAMTATPWDAVICTHPFASLIMRRVRRDHPDAPFYGFVATDYTCSPYVAESQADVYMIPDEKLRGEFMNCGIPGDRIRPTGIPVRQVFFQPRRQAQSRSALGLPLDKKIILLICGSMGCGPMKQLARELTRRLPEKAMLVAICGRNEKLREELLELGNLPNLRVQGFTTDMPLYMDAADLLLTKPGGLSSTEAAAKRLPMIFIDAVGGCEGRNLEFYTGHNLATAGSDVEELTELVCAKLRDPGALAAMARTLEENFPHNGAVEICDCVVGQVGGSR